MVSEGLLHRRERVLAVLWLVGAALTASTLLLRYDLDVDRTARTVVALSALTTGLVLLRVPPLPDAVVHGVLVVAAGVIAFCSDLGVPEVEGVLFALPVVFAFGAFPRRQALPHLALVAALYALILGDGTPGVPVSPTVPWALVVGSLTVVAFAFSALLRAAQEERARGARDHRIAEALQQTLLPASLPSCPGVAVTGRYVAAAAEADVGGDLYDAVVLGHGRLGIAIGDVAGKGLDAAIAVGRVRAALEAYAHDDPAPAEVLRRLNRFLCDDPAGPMVTLAYGILDVRRGRLRWASAGHLPPLVVPAGGIATYGAISNDLPLGVARDATFVEQEVALAGGDRVLLFTDGLVERRGAELDAALERLRIAGEQAAPDSEALIEAALATPEGDARDDVAVVVVELLALGDRLDVELPCRPEALADLRVEVHRWLEGRCPPPVAQDLVLACSEAAADAIAHADADGGGAVTVSVVTDDDGSLRFVVRDGRPRPDEARRSLKLMRGLVDSVDVTSDADGTEVRLVRAPDERDPLTS